MDNITSSDSNSFSDDNNDSQGNGDLSEGAESSSISNIDDNVRSRRRNRLGG